MSSGSGGGTTTRYTASPQQKRLLSKAMPLVTSLSNVALGRRAPSKLWEVPGLPQTPAPVLPTEGWLQNIAPEVMAGITEPYRIGEQYLEEKLGSEGTLGTARAGYTGAGGAALGRYWGTAAPQIGMQAWQMVAPEQMRFGQQQYAGEMQRRGEILQRGQAPYTITPGFVGSVGQLTPTGVTTPSPGFSPGGFLGGAAMGGLTAAAIPALATPLGIGAAALGLGLMGGMKR
jgi:hypothetical protein